MQPITDDTTFAPDNPAVVAVQADYFGFGAEDRFVFPDGVTYISFSIMNEGQRRDFQKSTNRDIKFNRATNDATIKADPAEERWKLITTSCTGWNLIRAGRDGQMEPVLFNRVLLEQWLSVANPKLVDDLEFTIRQANPWMQADMTVEEIDKEIDRLNGLREQVQEREKGK